MPSARPEISRALLAAHQEAFLAATLLVPPALRAQFVLVGSGAVLYHGSRRRAEDLDIVGTADAHGAFLDGAREDERFSVMTDGGRVYHILLLVIHVCIPWLKCVSNSFHTIHCLGRRGRRPCYKHRPCGVGWGSHTAFQV